MESANCRAGPGTTTSMTALDVRCVIDHVIRNGFLKLQYRLRRLGLPRQIVVKGLLFSELLLKALRILR